MADKSTTKPPGRGRPAVSPAHRKAMQVQIAEAAQRLFSTEGYGQVSMRRIAAEVGCAPMTLYKYYDAKIDILRTLWGGVFEAVFAHVIAEAETAVSPDTKLTQISHAYVSYWLEQPDHYRLVFMAEGVTQPDVSLFVDTPEIAQQFRVFAEAIVDAHTGKLDTPTLKVKLDALLCLLHGIAHNKITISGYPWAEIDALIAIGVRGILAK